MPLLLIHGFPLDGRIWEAQVGPLSKRGRVIVPDLPGFGRSAPEPIGSIDDYARALLGLLDRIGVTRFAAAGHSMGGYVALALQRLAPERLAGLVLVASRAAADPEEARPAREAMAKRAEAEGVEFLARSMPERQLGTPTPGLVERLRGMIRAQSPAGVAAACRAMALRPDARAQLASLRIPVVVIAGRLDRIVPPSESESMASGFRLVWSEVSGHLPMIEDPTLVASSL